MFFPLDFEFAVVFFILETAIACFPRRPFPFLNESVKSSAHSRIMNVCHINKYATNGLLRPKFFNNLPIEARFARQLIAVDLGLGRMRWGEGGGGGGADETGGGG